MKYSFLSYSAIDKKPEKILFIGLGAGIMPRFINKNFPESKIDAVEVDKTFTMLMGDEVAPRRKFIETYAHDVKNLDV